MAVEVYKDTVETLALRENRGGFNFIQRKMLVNGLTATDYSAMMDALTAAGVPVYGDVLTEAPNLKLTTREVRMLDNKMAEVTLSYEPNVFQQKFEESAKASGEASLNQVQTNKDKNGDTITISHTYPNLGNSLGEEPDADHANKTFTQGGQIDYLQPQLVLKFSGTMQSSNAVALALSVIGKVNDDTWMEGSAKQWLCTGCGFKVINSSASPIEYEFNLEFQYNPDGWDPTVIFADDRTGKPPEGLVAGTGYKTVERYEPIDFDATFGITFGS
jgi:hypothetical protein